MPPTAFATTAAWEPNGATAPWARTAWIADLGGRHYAQTPAATPLMVIAMMEDPAPSIPAAAASAPTAGIAELGRHHTATRRTATIHTIRTIRIIRTRRTATRRTATIRGTPTIRIRTATIRTSTRQDKPAQTRVQSQMTMTATTAAPEASFTCALSEPTALTADLGRHLGTPTVRTATIHTATRLAQRDKPAQTRVISSSPTVTATTAGPDPSILSAASGPTATTATTAESPAPMRRTAACSGLMVLALFRAAFAQENPTSAVTLPKRRRTARKHAAHGAAQ